MERAGIVESPRFNKSDLEKVFPQESAEGSYMLCVIAIHGNEPQIMTSAIATEINEILENTGLKVADIVVPDVYGENTKRILREEFPQALGRIFVCEKLGQILKKTEFSTAGYPAHMRSVSQNQPQVQYELLEFLSRPFTAQSLTGEEKEFEPKGKRLEINAGANVSASDPDTKNTHFVFPVMLSELVTATLEDPVIGRYYDKRILEDVLVKAHKLEAAYRTTLIPIPDTFSFRYPDIDTQLRDYLTRGITATPPLKKIKEPPKEMPRDSIYLMASGSGLGVNAVRAQAEQLEHRGFNILRPIWMNFDFGQIAPPNAIFHPEVKAVMGRPGFGTLWTTQVAEKPFIVIPGDWSESPEMWFNEKSVISTGLGDVISDREDLIENLVQLGPRIRRLNQTIYNFLEITPDADGIRYAAEKILETEINKIPNT